MISNPLSTSLIRAIKNHGHPLWGAVLVGVLVWIMLVLGVWIAPVWDEQGMLNSIQQKHSLYQLLQWIWLESRPYRPFSNTLSYPILYGIQDKALAWQVMRGINTLVLLLATVVYFSFLQQQRRLSPSHKTIIIFVLLFSPAMLMVASWGPNLFDAWSYLFIAIGLWSLGRNKYVIATLCFSLSFFCKEISILIFPFLLYWWLNGKIKVRPYIAINIALLLAFTLYMLLRSRVIELGGSTDIHSFDVSKLHHAFYLYVSTMWQQSIASIPYLGWCITGIMFWQLRTSWPALLGGALLIIASAVLYQNMLHLGTAPIIAHTVFQPRLYLIPGVLLLVIILLHSRSLWIPLLLLIPLQISGLIWHFMYYHQFQTAYKHIEQKALNQKRPLHILGQPGTQFSIWNTSRLSYTVWLPSNAPSHLQMDYQLLNSTGQLVALPKATTD